MSDYEQKKTAILMDFSEIRKGPKNETELKEYNATTKKLSQAIDSLVQSEVRKAEKQLTIRQLLHFMGTLKHNSYKDTMKLMELELEAAQSQPESEERHG